MRTNTRPLVLTVTQAGALLGVGRSTAYELVRSGELESIRLRRRCVVPVAMIARKLGIAVPDIWAALNDPQNEWLAVHASPAALQQGASCAHRDLDMATLYTR